MRSYLWMFLETVALVSLSTALWCFKKRTRYFHDIATCNELLRTSNLAKRAAPNGRVKNAFGIENSFTTIDTQYHQDFLDSVRVILNRHDNDKDRTRIAAEVTQNARYLLLSQKDLSLEKLVKAVVFRAVLAMFFPDLKPPSTTEVELLTDTIDSLWYDSKSPWKILLAKYLPSRSSVIEKREILHSKLKEIFLLPPQEIISARSNPLNEILPAYIGLWKVVLKSLIEVRFRSTSQKRDEYASLLSAFLKQPKDAWYRKNESNISAQSIIAETLRLYPPTRRIYMRGEDGITRAVDIEKMHHNGDIWGENPNAFNPHRWGAGLDVMKTQEYMPFGSKHEKISRCPSRRRGGPKLCALLLGVLFHEIDDGWELIDEDMVLGAEPLGSAMAYFKKLMLRRTSPTHSF